MNMRAFDCTLRHACVSSFSVSARMHPGHANLRSQAVSLSCVRSCAVSCMRSQAVSCIRSCALHASTNACSGDPDTPLGQAR
eukprot:366357-Chlamydomonas_euryale.AAC.5